MDYTTELMPWLHKLAKQNLEIHLNDLNQRLDEQTQIFNKKFDTHNPTVIPLEYLEYQIKYTLDGFRNSIIKVVMQVAKNAKLTVKNVYPIEKAVMLNKKSNSLLQLAKLDKHTHHFEELPQLAFIDIETDSVNIQNTNILQVAIIKPMIDPLHPSLHHFETWNKYILPHSQYKQKDNKAFHINNIGEKELSLAAPMKDVSDHISDLLKNTVIVGYNCNKFDIPILKRHLEANNAKLDHKFSIDLYPACWKNRKQNLAGALETYLVDKNHNPHDATADANCCIELLFALINKNIIPSNEEELISLSKQPNNTWREGCKMIEINPTCTADKPNFKRRHSEISSISTSEGSSSNSSPSHISSW